MFNMFGIPKGNVAEAGRQMARNPGTYIGCASFPSVLVQLGAHLQSLEDAAGYLSAALMGAAAGYIVDEYMRVYLGRVSPTVRQHRTTRYTFYECQHRTNRQSDAAILVADSDLSHHVDTAMYNHFRKRRKFLGYPIDDVHLKTGAKASDLRDVIINEDIGSVVLFGHSSWGTWTASDRNVSWQDVREWTRKSGHCKNGFGIKMGCNPISDSSKDDYQLLAPAFGHREHSGSLYIIEGVPDNPLEPDSMVPAGTAETTRPRLRQLVHR